MLEHLDFTAGTFGKVVRGQLPPFTRDFLRVFAIMLDFATLGQSEAPFPADISTDHFVRIREVLEIEGGFDVVEVGTTGKWVIRWDSETEIGDPDLYTTTEL